MERGIRKILTFVKRSIASKIVGKITLKPWLVISKSLKFPQDDRTDTNFIALLRTHFQRSKSTLDSLKRLFNAFRRKASLVPLNVALTVQWKFESNFVNKQSQATVNSRVQLHQKQSKIRAQGKLLEKSRLVDNAYATIQKPFGTFMANFQTQRQTQDSHHKKGR